MSPLVMVGGLTFIEHLLCARHVLEHLLIYYSKLSSFPPLDLWTCCALCSQHTAAGLRIWPLPLHILFQWLSPERSSLPICKSQVTHHSRFPHDFLYNTLFSLKLPYSLFSPCLLHHNANSTGENALYCHRCNPRTRNWAGSWQQLHKCLSNEWNSPWKRYHYSHFMNEKAELHGN